ncbi:MAG TPA: hypothetical protein VNZ57_04945, partial [Longimicrobiales bacterium]|nr:hypothetical protein [Longimicrobiales bacterium]
MSGPRRSGIGRINRRAVGWFIVATWLVVVAAHVRREYFKPPAVRLAEGALALAPGTHFYRIQMDGATIGLASSSMDTVPTGFTLIDQMALDVPALGSSQRASARTRVDLGRSLEVSRFEFDLESTIGRFVVTGEVRSDSVMAIEIDAGGGVERMEVPWNRDVALAAALPLRLAASGRLRVGTEVTATIFDPSVLEPRDVVVRVSGQDTIIVADSVSYDPATGVWTVTVYDTVPAWRIEESYGGVRVSSWVDGDGRLVRAESPLGFRIERDAFEITRAAWRESQADTTAGSGYGSLIEATAIAAGVTLPGGAGPDRLAVRLLNVDLVGFDLDGGRQTLRGDTLVVAREAVDPTASYRLPYTGGGEAAGELAATPLIQAS